MPKYHVTLHDGRNVEIEAESPELADKAAGEYVAAHPAQKKRGAVEDFVKNFAGNIPVGVAGIGDMVMNAIPGVALANQAMSGNPLGIPTLAKPTGNALTKIASRLAPKPQTVAGEYGRTGALMLPGAAVPGSIPARIANVVIPTLTSETAGQVARAVGGGGVGEQVARVAGALLGGGAASLRLRPPNPAAQALPPRVASEVPMIAPSDAGRANAYAAKVAKSAGVTPEALRAGPQDVTAAEALGQTGKTAVAALARREGATGDKLKGLIASRRIARPQRVLDSFSRVAGVEPQAVADVPADSARAIEAASQAPEAISGSGGRLVHARLNQEFDAARANVDSLYDAARQASPEGAQLTSDAKPVFGQQLREAMADFDPDAVPRVTAQLEKFDKLKSATARDLFEMRTRVGKLRASSDPVEGEAAGTLVRAIDRAMADGMENEAFTGDASVLQLWRDAIAARREMGQQFQGGDLIQNLTERVHRGGQRTNAVAAEDASNAMFGRGGVSGRPNAVRDLTRLRERLGAGSPEWQAVQNEAVSRVLGRDAGRETFGQSWDRFSQQNPELADLLMSPTHRQALGSSRATIARAQAARDAFNSGADDVFNANVSARQLGDHFAALSQADQTALRSGVASRLYNMAQSGRFEAKALTVPHVEGKLRVLFGEDGARQIVATAQREAEMAAFERRFGPDTNSITSDMRAAMGEQDELAPLHQAIADFIENVPRGPKAAAGSAVRGMVEKGLATARTPGMPVPARDAAGEILMLPPAELAALLESLPKPQSRFMLGGPAGYLRGLTAPPQSSPQVPPARR